MSKRPLQAEHPLASPLYDDVLQEQGVHALEEDQEVEQEYQEVQQEELAEELHEQRHSKRRGRKTKTK